MAVLYNPGIVTDGLVLCLDAANPKSYPGSGTAWRDLSGRGNNGTLTNGPTFSTSNGGSIVFDGSNDYIDSPCTKTATCSFSCWARTTTLASNPMLFNSGPDGQGPDLFFYNGKISWNTWDADANPLANIPSSANDGNWHHYVVINDAASTTKLYYDSVLIGSATYRSSANNTNLTIGGNTNTYQWNGSISSFMLHNKLLSPTEISQNFNALRGRFGI
jgi:hypothetical protein